MFQQSIDNYSSLCEQFGKEPDKEFKGTFNVRISPELHRKMPSDYSELIEGKCVPMAQEDLFIILDEILVEMGYEKLGLAEQ